MVKACLVVVTSGEAYSRYAKGLFWSARDNFYGDTLRLKGREGWPAATLYRYHVLLENEDRLSAYDYIYLCDADMRFEATAGVEIYGEITATQHPGYVHGVAPPYERRPESAAYVKRGTTYYAGGFVGGERQAFLSLARAIAAQVDADDAKGIVATWHDESHLNAYLAEHPPSVTLSPSYCFPDDSSGYPWLADTKRILVALDKTAEERGER